MTKIDKANKTARLHVRMTPERMKQLEQKANLLETTPSMLVRKWISEKLNQGNKANE